MRHLICIVLSALLLSSCEKTVLLDLRQVEPKIVIEAVVTNQPGRQFVKVSRSAGFYDSGRTPRVTDATVIVEDNLGNLFNFTHNPSHHPDSAGFYVPITPFTGIVGRAYHLTVMADGKTFEAQDNLLSVIPIDSLQYRVIETESLDPKYPGKIYEVLLFAREARDEVNFYLFQFYRNDSLILYNNNDVYFSDDEFLGEKIDGVPSPVFFGTGDLARVEVLSLTRTGFVFYRDLWGLLNNDAGGMFGAIPATPRTNLTNGALGFFRVSAISASEILIE